MADKKLKIRIDLESSGAVSELAALAEALERIGKEGKTTSTATKAVSQSLLDASNKVKTAHTTVERFNTDLTELANHMRNAGLQVGLFNQTSSNTKAVVNALAASLQRTASESGNISRAVAVMRGAFNNAVAVLKHTHSALSQVRSGIGLVRSAFTSLRKQLFSLRTAVVALGIGFLAKSFIDAAATAESFRTRLNRALRSTEEGAKVFKDMKEFAAKVPFEFKEILQAATTLSGVMERGSEDIKQFIPIIADVAAISGLSIEDTTQNMIRALSAGAAAADLFRQRGVLAMLGFTGKVTATAEETRAQIIKAWEDPFSRFRDASEDLGKTWFGLTSILRDQWFLLRDAVMEAGLFDFLKRALSGIINKVKEFRTSADFATWAKNASDKIQEFSIKAIEFIGSALQFLQQVLTQIIGIVLNLAKAVFRFRDAWNGVESSVHKAVDAIIDYDIELERLQRNVETYQKALEEALNTTEEGTDNFEAARNKIQGLAKALDLAERELERYTIHGIKPAISAEHEDILERERSIKGLQDLNFQLSKSTFITNLKKAAVDALRGAQKELTAEEKRAEEERRKLREEEAARLREIEQAAQKERERKQNLAKELKEAQEAEEKRSALAKVFAEIRIDQAQTTAARLDAERRKEIEATRSAAQERLFVIQAADNEGRLSAEAAAKAREAIAEALQNKLTQISQQGDLAKAKALEEAKFKLAEIFAEMRVATARTAAEKIAAAQQQEVNEVRQQAFARNQALKEALDAKQLEQDQYDDALKTSAKALQAELTRIEKEGLEQRRQQRSEAAKFISDVNLAAAKTGNEQFAIEQAQRTKAIEDNQRVQLEQAQAAYEAGLLGTTEYEAAKVQIIQGYQNELIKIREAGEQRQFDATKMALQGAADAFGTFYELAGSKGKEFFYAQKALNIALAMMDTFTAAQAAYASAAKIDSVVLAPTMAALAVAQGLARVAIISRQSLAAGGGVDGHSPTATADNIPAWLTAGEYVQPVKTVRYYGNEVMEALRKRAIPRDLLASYRSPTRPPSNRFAFQAGGAVGGLQSDLQRQASQGQPPINLVNVVGKDQFEQYLASRPGQNMILNVIRDNQFQAQLALRQG